MKIEPIPFNRPYATGKELIYAAESQGAIIILSGMGPLRASALDQHLPQVFATAFGDAEQTMLTACGRVPRDKPSQATRSRPRAKVCQQILADPTSILRQCPSENILNPLNRL
jgi:hypothetical protein